MRPSATVPEPSGKPPPSGAMAAPRPRTSSGVGGLPTPNRGDCAANVAAPANTTASAIPLRVHIGHRSVGLDSPEFRAVEVVDRVPAAHGDELFTRRLYIAGLVDGPRSDDGFPALETPRHSEPRQCDRQPRFLQLRGGPTPSAVRRDFHA